MRMMLALALSLMASTAMAQNWSDPDLGRAIREGSATANDIWLLGETGKLVHFERGTGVRTLVAEKVVDILEDGPHLWVASRMDEFGYRLTDARAPQNEGRTLHAENIVSLVVQPQGLAAVGTEALHMPTESGGWRDRSIAGSVSALGRHVVAATSDGATYYGVNRGEWGGGLRRIANQTGAVSIVVEDNITTVVQDPANPECVLYAAGLAHMSISTGRVGRVCGDQASTVFQKSRPTSWNVGPAGSSWPIESLALLTDGWIAVSSERYFLNRKDEVVERPMPVMTDWSGLRVSQPTDGALFVVTACCWGSSDRPQQSVLALLIRD